MEFAQSSAAWQADNRRDTVDCMLRTTTSRRYQNAGLPLLGWRRANPFGTAVAEAFITAELQYL